MEQHPVPQNVIGFQFKLIGDMTVRQFIYLAGGILLSYLIFQLDLPVILKWPLGITAGAGGFAFAFVPLEERPLDRWLICFFQRIFLPTQFLWEKRGLPPEILTVPIAAVPLPTAAMIKKDQASATISEYLSTLPSSPQNDFDHQENQLLSRISSVWKADIYPVLPNQSNQPPVNQPVKMPPKPISQQTQELTDKIIALEKEMANQAISQERFLEIQLQLISLLNEKEKLQNELMELKKQLIQKPRDKTTSIKIVTPQTAPDIGLPKFPILPNTISGMVKNYKEAILPGIIVEIKNQEGTTMRALKTGKLGQFTVTTPLSNGTYTVHLEDPQKTYHFDIIEINLNGKIVPPLEILAKTEKDNLKEELKKKLFNNDTF